MKKILCALALSLCSSTYVNAQVTAAEPEFSEETLLLTSDSTGVILKRENGYVKAKAGASLYLTGIGKIKSRLTIDGVKSINTTKGQKETRTVRKEMRRTRFGIRSAVRAGIHPATNSAGSFL